MTYTAQMRGPDFIIIGAMKCMTTTLHNQLAAQDGIFMTTPKEPCYFSDDGIYGKGPNWYSALFAGGVEADLCGESSTHYTKLPTYPMTVDRMHKAYPDLKLIYVMRDPIERLISQFIHEWTQRRIRCPIDVAIDRHPELLLYSCYAYQLEPYMRKFRPTAVLPVFFERLKAHPEFELRRICRFLGYPGIPNWRPDLNIDNVSKERMRKSGWRDAIIYAPGISWLRQKLIPRSTRNAIKLLWQLRERPQLSPRCLAHVTLRLDKDLSRLGNWLGVPLSCRVFQETATSNILNWQPGLHHEFASRDSDHEVAM